MTTVHACEWALWNVKPKGEKSVGVVYYYGGGVLVSTEMWNVEERRAQQNKSW